MKNVCKNCGEILPKWRKDIVCERCGYINEHLYYKDKKLRILKRVLTFLSVIFVIVGTLVVCDKAMLYPWQSHTRSNRKAMLEYAHKNYPEAKIVKENYPSLKFNVTAQPHDVIWFELDGVEFFISARDGKVSDDRYGVALMEKAVREDYLNDFFVQRGLSYRVGITFYDRIPLPTEQVIDPKNLTETISLDIVLEYEEDKQTPRDFDWFYDFYCYWKEKCPTGKFSIRFCYKIKRGAFYSMYCDSGSEFDSEDDFYNQFKYIT
ncbi:MAG: hypothetical protein J1F04_07075 [Oscillospiraceae bacterium]|nr:hypothetical protein [Oscillospiraceae bacterium]